MGYGAHMFIWSELGTKDKTFFIQDLGEMNSILASSVDELKKYKENAEQLNKHLESSNTIYGNMLGAMSYKK